mmetsp:Transcript_55119/g.113818  ORF Transcript_55119/g.113818 Transcript_55119/m.113818 type:complete len:299 (-) Transcript_55119:371-1267(-)
MDFHLLPVLLISQHSCQLHRTAIEKSLWQLFLSIGSAQHSTQVLDEGPVLLALLSIARQKQVRRQVTLAPRKAQKHGGLLKVILEQRRAAAYKLLQFWVRWRLKRIVFQQPGLLLLQPFQCMAEQPKVCQLVVELLDRLRLKRTAAPFHFGCKILSSLRRGRRLCLLHLFLLRFLSASPRFASCLTGSAVGPQLALRRHRTASHWTRSGFRQFVTIVARALLALLALLLALAGFPVLCMLLDLIVIVCSSGYFYLCLCLQHRLRDLEILFIRDLRRVESWNWRRPSLAWSFSVFLRRQ